jgi:hypothetical protein
MTNRVLFLLALIAVVAVQPASAQLSGTYTVDNTQPTGGGNYNNLPVAVADLIGQGVSGPVVFSINTGTGTYGGFGIGGAIPGSSATNTVTFQPGPAQTPVISGPAAGNVQTIKLGTAATAGTGPANIILSGLTVTGAPTGAGILTAGATNISILNCTVYGTAGQTGAGIQLVVTTNSTVRGCEVHTVGMTAGTPGTPTYSGGISTYQASSGCTISHNKVHDCTGNGIHVGASAAGSAASGVTVINNMVWNCPGSSTYPGGISTRRTPGLVLSNNSVLMSSGANGGIAMTATDGGASAEVSNNVVRHLGTGACFEFEATGTLAATVFDYNVYDPGPTAFVGAVGATTYSTLAAWQAVAAPSLAGKEINTVVGSAGFISGADLHITPLCAGFNNGSAVGVVTDDIDGEARTVPLCRGADEIVGTGLWPAFTATPLSGGAPLNVSFTDQTFTSDPMGLTMWAWDFQNDGTDDAFVQNPAFNYLVPGTYSVKLTATDAMHGSVSFTKTSYITVGPYVFDAQTTPGTGDLTINGVPGVGSPGATSGYLFVSFAIPPVLGSGPFFGLIPDSFTWSIVTTPAAVGGLTHWILAPGFFPNVPLVLPPGSLAGLIGSTVDLRQIDLTASGTIANLTNIDRITF